MGRPLIIYKLADLKDRRVLDNTESWTLRIEKPDFRVWLSVDEKTVRVEERVDNGPWREVERDPAR